MIDTAALREKVLDLAIRGKLVPQDPNDEPASVLLERIHEQKLQMVREGKLKAKDVKDDTIIFKGDDNCYYEKFSDGSVKNIQDEIPFDLPDSWSWCRLNTISKDIFAGGDKPSKISKVKTNNCPIAIYSNGTENNGLYGYTDIPRVNDVSITVSARGTIGFCCVRKEPFVPIIRLITIIPSIGINETYLSYTFKAILETGNGSSIPQLTVPMVSPKLIPLPPYVEQLRIVDIIEKTIDITNTLNKLADEVQALKSSLQSKILELAIQGKLVPQDENDEPASVLLERIRAERKAKLGKKYVESYIFKGDDNCYYENMPKNWVKCRLSDIADLERGITFSASAKETIKTKKNIACIRTANVQDELDLDDLIYVDRAYTKNNERKLLRVGDIIMSSANSKELVGKSCIVKHFDGEMTFGGFVLVIRSIQIIPEFLLICLKYLFLKGAFYNESTQTTNIANISTKIIESLEISLPPLMEQQRIINKITTLFNILKDGV